MKLVIDTQYQENYSDVPGQYYWKQKGGSIYVVEDVTLGDDFQVVELDEVKPFIEINNEACISTIIGWEVLGDCEELEVDSWEQIEVFRKVDGQWTSSITQNAQDHFLRGGIEKLVRSWDIASDGKKSNYQVEYHMSDGTVCHSDKEALAWYENVEQEVA